MKGIITILLIVLIFSKVQSQVNYYDSAKVYTNKDIKVSLAFADSALILATSDVDVAKSNYLLGYLYRRTKEYIKSIEHYQASMTLYKDIDMQQYMCLQLNQGINYELINSFELATHYYDRTIMLAIELDDNAQLAKAQRQKARVYRMRNKLDSAVIINLLALEYYNETEDKKYRSSILCEIGLVLLKLDKAKESINYFYAAEREVDLEPNNYMRSARTNYYVGKATLLLGDTLGAANYFSKAEQMFIDSETDHNYVELLFDMAPLMQDPTSTYKKAVTYAENNGLWRIDAYRESVFNLAGTGAIGYLDKYRLVSNALISEQRSALALHQEQYGKEIEHRLKTATALNYVANSFKLGQFILFTMIGVVALVGLFLMYRRETRKRVKSTINLQLKELNNIL